ncbi:MAG: hypothetical protein AVDCRST_MAG09-478, partial [uncultured Sphingomonas sp.]
VALLVRKPVPTFREELCVLGAALRRSGDRAGPPLHRGCGVNCDDAPI